MSDAIMLRLPDALAMPPESEEDKLIRLWLHGLSRHTARAYRSDIRAFRRFCALPLAECHLADLQAYAAHLEALPLTAGSRHRFLSGVKSLFAFAHRIGMLSFDVSRPLRLPAGKDALNERILSVEEVMRLFDAAEGRDRAILELLYFAGLRVSELQQLSWGDLRPRADGGQCTVLGKGNKTRTVLIPAALWGKLMAMRPAPPPLTALIAPPPLTPPPAVFVSDRGRLSVSQVLRVTKAAAKRAGINKPVSPHWLRHCHCSHALDNGCPIHLVQQTVGHSSVATTSRYLHARPNESSGTFLRGKA